MSFTPALFVYFVVEKSKQTLFHKAFEDICCLFSIAPELRLLTCLADSSAWQIALPIPRNESILELFEPYGKEPEWYEIEGQEFYLLCLNQSASESESYIIYNFSAATMLDQFILGTDVALESMETLTKKVNPYWGAILSYDVFLSLDGKREKAEFNWLSYELTDSKIIKVKEKFVGEK